MTVPNPIGPFGQYIPAMKDAGPYQAMSFGVAGVTFTSADQHSAAAAVTDVPATGKSIVVTALEISADTTMYFSFTEENTGILVGKYFLLANTSFVISVPLGKRKLSAAGNRLMVETSVSGNIAVTAHYYSEL